MVNSKGYEMNIKSKEYLYLQMILQEDMKITVADAAKILHQTKDH